MTDTLASRTLHDFHDKRAPAMSYPGLTSVRNHPDRFAARLTYNR